MSCCTAFPLEPRRTSAGARRGLARAAVLAPAAPGAARKAADVRDVDVHVQAEHLAGPVVELARVLPGALARLAPQLVGSCGIACGSWGAGPWLSQLATHTNSAGTFPWAIALSGAGFAYTPGRAPALLTVAHQAFVYAIVFVGALLKVPISTSRQSGKLPV